MSKYKNFPTVIVKGACILPGLVTHIDIDNAKSVRAVEEAMMGDEEIFIIAQKNLDVAEPLRMDLYSVGIVASVKQIVHLKDGAIRVVAEGLNRAMLGEILSDNKFLLVNVEIQEAEDEEDMDEAGNEAMLRGLREAYVKFLVASESKKKDTDQLFSSGKSLGQILDIISSQLSTTAEGRQAIVETTLLSERYQLIVAMLLNEIEVCQIKNDFQKKVRAQVDKNQKEYLLREQQKVIREELGESNTESDADEYRKKLAKLDASDEVKEKIEKEIKRFSNLPGSSSESAVIRGYIETLLELPWNVSSTDNKDLKRARKIITRDHYGLDKVKERMLEFLAVRNLTSAGEAPIICLVGPPGTGKTSIAKAVAEALEKKYVRICLGGVKDEAEIRGHRKTYVGAMPGRLVNALKTAGVNNPLILLDEIDKVSNDYKGDTHSALLEVLDHEQNSRFTDHYVELPVDLSNVLFIATANGLDTIPRPLLDRMEVIEVNSYTSNEKVHIATDHLIPKQLKKNGLDKSKLTFSESAVEKIIDGYTKESGVRGLERKISEVCRKVAREIYEKETDKVKVTKSNLTKYLGQVKYTKNKTGKKNEIGIVTGLAWTSVGGVTLEVEVNTMPGKGEMKLTGKMGDVMKESAQAALTYVRSIAGDYGVPEDYFAKHDIHIHIPEGAVPKDGPSAGVTMATAILSAVAKIPARCDVAMTGEITLRGRALPIGGLKEKLLAAKTAGAKKVFIPKENAKDLEDISEEILDGLEIVKVSHVKDIISETLVK